MLLWLCCVALVPGIAGKVCEPCAGNIGRWTFDVTMGFGLLTLCIQE